MSKSLAVFYLAFVIVILAVGYGVFGPNEAVLIFPHQPSFRRIHGSAGPGHTYRSVIQRNKRGSHLPQRSDCGLGNASR